MGSAVPEDLDKLIQELRRENERLRGLVGILANPKRRIRGQNGVSELRVLETEIADAKAALQGEGGKDE
jgi:hypothetical protein